MAHEWLAGLVVRFLLLIALGGCELYFGPGPQPEPQSHALPDACGGSIDAPVDAQMCPAAGTYAQITYPLDGATNVPTPVPIAMHVFIPNTLTGKGIYLTDTSGQLVDLSHYDPTCSVQPPPIQTGPTQDVTWTECYDLPPDSEFTWHIWITCYDASGPHEIAKSTFRTAAGG